MNNKQGLVEHGLRLKANEQTVFETRGVKSRHLDRLVIQGAVQAAIEAGAANSGDTVAVLSGMMTELEGLDTANILKVHVASETLASGRAVVSGYAAGPLYRVDDGNLDGIPAGAILAVPAGFDGEFSGKVSKLGGILDEHEGVTGYAAVVARELGIPMVGSASIPDVSNGTDVTIDGERGVVYAGPLEDVDRA